MYQTTSVSFYSLLIVSRSFLFQFVALVTCSTIVPSFSLSLSLASAVCFLLVNSDEPIFSIRSSVWWFAFLYHSACSWSGFGFIVGCELFLWAESVSCLKAIGSMSFMLSGNLISIFVCFTYTKREKKPFQTRHLSWHVDCPGSERDNLGLMVFVWQTGRHRSTIKQTIRSISSTIVTKLLVSVFCLVTCAHAGVSIQSS